MFGPSKKELLKRIRKLEDEIYGENIFLNCATQHSLTYRLNSLINIVKKQQALLNEIIDDYYSKKKKD